MDCKSGKNGLVSFLRADLEHGWPDTLTAGTPSGGFHLYYRQTNAVRFVTGRKTSLDPAVIWTRPAMCWSPAVV